jgi:hypothetical protein
MNSTCSVNIHGECDVVVSKTIICCSFFVVHGLESIVSCLLLRLHDIDSIEFLNLSFLLVKVHDDGLVVCLTDAVNKCIVL